jgi:hypothetical protein
MHLTPTLEVVDDRIATSSSYDPNDILFTVVNFLVLSIRWYESEVSRRKLLSLRTVRATHNGAMTARSIHDGICVEFQNTSSKACGWAKDWWGG